MSDDLLYRMNTSVNKAEEAAQTTFDVLTGPLDTPIDVNGTQAPTLATRVRDYMQSVGGVDGADGKSLEFIEIRQDGHLWAKIEDQPEADLGAIVPTGVDYVDYNTLNGELKIALTDGTVQGPFDVKGDSAEPVDSVFIENGNLKLSLQDGTVLNAGDITQFGGAGANGADITEDGDLVILFSDGSTENIGHVRGDKGDAGYSLVSAGIDEFGVLRFLRSDGKKATAGIVNPTIIDNAGNIVTDVRLEGVDNNELVIETQAGTNNLGVVIGEDGVDGNDGVGITGFTTNNDEEMIIQLSDGSTHNAGKIQVTRVFNAGDISISDASISTNGELLIDVNVNGNVSQKNLGDITGKDGTQLTSVAIDPQSHIVFTDSDGGELDAGEVEQVTITSVDIDVDGKMEVGLSDGTSFTSTDPVKGSDGQDADGIAGAYVDSGTGHLFIEFEGTALGDADVGKVTASVETDVSLVNGELTFTMSDGQTFGPYTVSGRDGIYLTEASIQDGRVYVTYSDDQSVEVDIGQIEQLPTNATINTDETLTIEFDDGTSVSTTERVGAYDGDTIKSIAYDDVANSLTIEYSTNNRQDDKTLVVDNFKGYGVQDVTYDDVAEEITVSTNLPSKPTITFKAPVGVDGASVDTIKQEGDDLLIEYYDRGDLSTLKTFRGKGIFNNPEILGVSVDVNDDLVIDYDGNSVVFPTLKGADGNTITDISFTEQDLTITSTEETTTVPLVKGEDGVTIEDVSVSDVDQSLEIKVSDDPTPVSFPQLEGKDAVEGVKSITLGGSENRDMIVEKMDDTTITIPTVKGKDGVTIDSVSITGGVFDVSVSDGTTESFDLNTIAGIDGKSVESISLGGSSGRDLVITTNLDAPEDTITIPEVKGEDGKGIDSVALKNSDQDIEFTYTDQTTETLSGIGVYITDANVDVDGKLEITLSDSTTITSANVIKGRDGVGTGVNDVDFVNGELTVTLEDPDGTLTDVQAGDVSMVGVSGVRIEEDTQLNEGILWLDFDDGSSVEVGNVYGENGRYVTNVTKQPQSGDPSKEDLILEFNDGSTVNAGNATGEPGRSVTGADVSFGGDFTIEYDDGNFDLVGNIGTGAGLSVWNVDNKPYVEDQVVIHDGGLYMSTEPNNNDEPPASSWKALAFGDQVVQVRKPVAKTPSTTAGNTRPRLTGSEYAPIVSRDKRDVRVFEVDVQTGDFTAPVYSASVDSDYHDITGFDLDLGGAYKWRIMDKSVRGDVSEWSDEQGFDVVTETAQVPTVSIHPEEDVTDAFMAPEFQTSAFAMVNGTDTHGSTDWVVVDSNDNVVWDSIGDEDNLLSVIVPYGSLDKGETYRIRASHNGTSVSSGWSGFVQFAVSEMDYAKTPSVTGDSETFVGSTYKKTDAFGEYSGVGLSLDEIKWTITKVSDGSEVETGTTNTPEYTRQKNLESNTAYRITAEYVDARFGVVESGGFDFQFIQEIQKPTVSTTEDVNSFPSGGVLNGSSFNGTNDTHVSSDWEARDVNTDELLWSSIGDTVNLESIEFPIGGDTSLKDLNIRVRYNGEFVSSSWSDVLSIHTQEIELGVGSQTLLAGDMTDGFFGEVPVGELITGDALASEIGLSAGSSQHSDEPWLKFAIDEEVIYAAKKTYRYSISWDDIDAVNAVYDEEGSPIIEVDGFQFRVTLLTGAEADPTVEENGVGSEWNRLIYRVHEDVPDGSESRSGGAQEGDNWAEYTDAELLVDSSAGDGSYSWCQESKGSSRVLRGDRGLSYFGTTSSDYSSSTAGWRPALRLLK